MQRWEHIREIIQLQREKEDTRKWIEYNRIGSMCSKRIRILYIVITASQLWVESSRRIAVLWCAVLCYPFIHLSHLPPCVFNRFISLLVQHGFVSLYRHKFCKPGGIILYWIDSSSLVPNMDRSKGPYSVIQYGRIYIVFIDLIVRLGYTSRFSFRFVTR